MVKDRGGTFQVSGWGSFAPISVAHSGSQGKPRAEAPQDPGTPVCPCEAGGACAWLVGARCAAARRDDRVERGRTEYYRGGRERAGAAFWANGLAGAICGYRGSAP